MANGHYCYDHLQDFRPRMPSAARQAEQQLAKASSVTSLAPKPKGKAAKGTKGKAAAAKGRKGGTPKKGNRVVWDSVPQKRRSGDRAGGPSAGRQFASAARLHQVSFQDLVILLECVDKSLFQRRVLVEYSGSVRKIWLAIISVWRGQFMKRSASDLYCRNEKIVCLTHRSIQATLEWINCLALWALSWRPMKQKKGQTQMMTQ